MYVVTLQVMLFNAFGGFLSDRFGRRPTLLAGLGVYLAGSIACLLAPDIDFGIFEKLLPRVRRVASSITVYTAASDRPLALSRQVHGYPRLGESGNDVSNLAGVEFIDVSDLPVMSPTGHLYHVYNADVGSDLNQLLTQNRHAPDRRNLVQAGGNLWRLQKDGAE